MFFLCVWETETSYFKQKCKQYRELVVSNIIGRAGTVNCGLDPSQIISKTARCTWPTKGAQPLSQSGGRGAMRSLPRQLLSQHP